jgi:hypothetical protein
MVENMDHTETEDVERLFSWLKAPMVHYREFAPQAELADAVATWPIVHKAAVQTGVAGEEEPAPHGDRVVKERMARDRMAMPAAAARAIRETPLPGTEAASEAVQVPDRPVDDGLAPQAVERPPIAPAARPAAPPPQPIARTAAPPPPAQPTAPPPAQARSTYYPGGGRGALFGGEYRGRERETPQQPVADRQDRSLDAVFTRLSGGRDRLPDPRERARTTPGLG